MKRYKALALRTVDMGFIEPHLTNEWGTYDVCLASDVADLEQRYRKAVELLRSEQKILTDDEYDRWDNKRIVFLIEEGEA